MTGSENAASPVTSDIILCMDRLASRLLLGLVGLLAVAGCDTEILLPVDATGEKVVDLAGSPAEDTAARCNDGEDNDGDGFVDCKDQDCQAFCPDRGLPDVGPKDAPRQDQAADLPADASSGETVPTPDLPAADLPWPDVPKPDLYVPDFKAPDLSHPDAGPPDLSTADAGTPCTNHHDCSQKWFCYLGKCIKDPKMDVFHCGKPGCPPGHWCVDAAGKKKECMENPAYTCKDACDCGPAHCCVKGACVKDTVDPWKPGGIAVLGLSCEAGKDPTYCCDAPECHAGRFAYGGGAGEFFRCHDKSQGVAVNVCGGKRCFGTACNCAPGEVCVDTTSALAPGQTCLLLSGGSCVSHAVAQQFYGFKAADLLSCCGKGCLKGSQCDAGWVRAGGKVAYQRVIGTCGSCGNGKCEEGEYPSTCAADCKCGDGRCAPGEVGLCKADCDTCGNGKCEPWEFADKAGSYIYPGHCPADCSGCGDGWCPPGEGAISCPKDCVTGRCVDAFMYPELYRACGDGICGATKTYGCAETETCLTCPQDCGPCVKAEVVRHPGAWKSGVIDGVWGTSATNVFAVGWDATIARWDGNRWAPMMSGWNARVYAELHGVHGSSPTNVYAVGRGFPPSGVTGVMLRFDGNRWRELAPSTTWQVYRWYDAWVAPSGDVFLAGQGRPTTSSAHGAVVMRYHGGQLQGVLAIPKGHLWAVWGSSSTDVYVVGNDLRHFNGAQWKTVPGVSGRAIWGSGPSDVFVVGDKIHHWDGKAWSASTLVAGTSLRGVWGTSPGQVVAVGYAGKNISAVLRFDGKSWSQAVLGSCRMLSSVWPAPSGEVFAGVSFINASCYGAIRHDGKTWHLDAGNTRATLYDVWGSAATDVYVGGDRVKTFNTTGDGLHFDGKSWSRVNSPVGIGALWGFSATEVYVLGNGLSRFDGTKWSTLPGFKSYYGIWGWSPSDIYLVGSAGKVQRFDGATWHPSIIPGNQSIVAVWGHSATGVHAVGKTTIASFDGAGWKTSATPKGVSLVDVWSGGASDTYVSGFRSSSQGIVMSNATGAWQEVKTSTPMVGYAQSIWGRSSSEIYTLVIGWASNQEHSSFVRYDGSTWKPMRTDLRRASSGSYVCPLMMKLRGVPGGPLYAVGKHEAIVRITP